MRTHNPASWVMAKAKNFKIQAYSAKEVYKSDGTIGMEIGNTPEGTPVSSPIVEASYLQKRTRNHTNPSLTTSIRHCSEEEDVVALESEQSLHAEPSFPRRPLPSPSTHTDSFDYSTCPTIDNHTFLVPRNHNDTVTAAKEGMDDLHMSFKALVLRSPIMETGIKSDQPERNHSHSQRDNSPKVDFLSQLPYELATLITTFLDVETLSLCRAVSRAWSAVASDDTVWEHKFHQKSWQVTRRPPGRFSWRHLYSQRHLAAWSWRFGEERTTTITGHSDSVYCIQFDEDKLVSGSRDQTIRFWDYRKKIAYRSFRGHTGSVLCLQYDDRILVSGSSDTTIIIWDMQSGEKLKILSGHRAGVLDISFDNQYIVSCSKDSTIRVWDYNNFQLLRTLYGHLAAVNAIKLKDGVVVSASGDYYIKMWDLETGTCIRDFVGHKRGIACLQYDGNLIVSGSNDHTIKIWDARTGACLHTLEGHRDLVRTLYFDKEFVVSGSYDQSIRVWDVKTGECIRDYQLGHDSWVFNVAFNLGRIITASQDQSIKVWEMADGIETRWFT